MTNEDYYGSKLWSNFFGIDTRTNLAQSCQTLACKNCLFHIEGKPCWEQREPWLEQEYVPKVAKEPVIAKDDQSFKQDNGKPKLSLAPIEEVWRAIAEVREYGIKKYHNPDNWRLVEIDRYWDALYRHIAATVNDHHSVDSESGIEHLKHALCNIAFILELEKKDENRTD